jgi:hypothetical protein
MNPDVDADTQMLMQTPAQQLIDFIMHSVHYAAAAVSMLPLPFHRPI